MGLRRQEEKDPDHPSWEETDRAKTEVSSAEEEDCILLLSTTVPTSISDNTHDPVGSGNDNNNDNDNNNIDNGIDNSAFFPSTVTKRHLSEKTRRSRRQR